MLTEAPKMLWNENKLVLGTYFMVKVKDKIIFFRNKNEFLNYVKI